MRQLQLLRHGKSDWDADYGSDHERPLAKRGRAAAAAMGKFITTTGLAPDAAVASTAVRARTTLEIAGEAGGWDLPTWTEPGFYGTGPETVLEHVRAFPDDYESVLIVGHQPTWGQLLYLLSGTTADFTTASWAVIDLSAGSWDAARPGVGALKLFIQARTVQAADG